MKLPQIFLQDKLEGPTLSKFPTRRVCLKKFATTLSLPHVKPMLPSIDQSNARFMPAMKKKEEKESFCSCFRFCHPLCSSKYEALLDTFCPDGARKTRRTKRTRKTTRTKRTRKTRRRRRRFKRFRFVRFFNTSCRE